jgi:hypothetical protein
VFRRASSCARDGPSLKPISTAGPLTKEEFLVSLIGKGHPCRNWRFSPTWFHRLKKATLVLAHFFIELQKQTKY